MRFIFPSVFYLLLVTGLTGCEVFKTTPRSSPNYRGPGSNSRYTHKAKTPPRTAARPAGKPRTTPSRPASAHTGSRPLASRPAGTYDENTPQVVQIARTYTGTPYRSGGNGKDGIDCSGLICQVYSEMGVKVPRISWQQSEFGREIDRIEDIRPGDWIFFVPEGGKEGYVSHSGIVTEVRGSNDIVFIHASSSRGVIEDNLFSGYFRNRFVKAVRPF